MRFTRKSQLIITRNFRSAITRKRDLFSFLVTLNLLLCLVLVPLVSGDPVEFFREDFETWNANGWTILGNSSDAEIQVGPGYQYSGGNGLMVRNDTAMYYRNEIEYQGYDLISQHGWKNCTVTGYMKVHTLETYVAGTWTTLFSIQDSYNAEILALKYCFNDTEDSALRWFNGASYSFDGTGYEENGTVPLVLDHWYYIKMDFAFGGIYPGWYYFDFNTDPPTEYPNPGTVHLYVDGVQYCDYHGDTMLPNITYPATYSDGINEIHLGTLDAGTGEHYEVYYDDITVTEMYIDEDTPPQFTGKGWTELMLGLIGLVLMGGSWVALKVLWSKDLPTALGTWLAMFVIGIGFLTILVS